MTHLRTLLLFIAAFVLQTTVAPHIQIFGVAPDFVLVFVVFNALRHGALTGVIWGFLAGFTEDVYGPLQWLGASSLAKCIVGFSVGLLEEKFLNLNLISKVAVLGVAFFVADGVYVYATGLEGNVASQIFLFQSLPEGVYTMLLGTIAFHLLPTRKVTRRML